MGLFKHPDKYWITLPLKVHEINANGNQKNKHKKNKTKISQHINNNIYSKQHHVFTRKLY